MLKKLGLFCCIIMLTLHGCMVEDWGDGWDRSPPSASPMAISDIQVQENSIETAKVKTIAVLLPLSGVDGDLGTGIQHAIEIAFFQKQPKNIMVSFHDINGTLEDKNRVIDAVIASAPDLVIGPLFSDDALILKDKKPDSLPAITFTSAKQVLGNGIFTLALLPNQAIEAIVKQIKEEDKKKLVIIYPDTKTGNMLANSAIDAADIYDLNIVSISSYKEKDTGDMKDLAKEESLYESRVENLTHVKEILSTVLINETLTLEEKESIKAQLEAMNKRDSLGDVPYDSVLFLGDAEDSKTLGAYFRYYDVPTDVIFYGSALWDSNIVHRDSSLAGGEYAGLPRISDSFLKLYSEIEGVKPNRFDTIGYDAAMLAIKALQGDKPIGAYLLDPSGYLGIDGLVRLKPNGENERALQIMQLNGIRLPMIKKRASDNFVKPIYQTSDYDLSSPGNKKLTSDGYNPIDFVILPANLIEKYKTENYGVIYDDSVEYIVPNAEHVEVVPEDIETIKDSEFEPIEQSVVDKKMIDEVEMKIQSEQPSKP